MEEKFSIAVIDTAAEKPILPPSLLIYNENNENELLGGHAIAICSIIQKNFKQSMLKVFPIFSNDSYETEPEVLLDTLEYILAGSEFKLVNMSLGIEYISNEHRYRLQNLCAAIFKKGIMLVAGYSNEGAMSYPACFESVIGVSLSQKVKKHSEYFWNESSPINIIGCPHPQRVKWDTSPFVFASGSSFVTAYITALLGKALYESQSNRLAALKMIKSKAIQQIKYPSPQLPICDIDIKNAVVFPFGKEIHSLVRFAPYLNFQLKAVYDIKYLGNVSRKVSEIIQKDLVMDYTIYNAEKLLYNQDFDTLILGHCDRIVDYLGKDFFNNLFESICKANKNIYALDASLYDIFTLYKKKWNSKSRMFFPTIEKQNIPLNQMGKLWRISSPVLTVLGTRSKQGKFTLQNMIKQEFISRNYQIEYLPTEPTGHLWGNKFTYPCGYKHAINVSMDESIAVINYIMHNLDMQNPDIILTGGQSGTIPYEMSNLAYSTLMQTAFLYGILPDAVVLCVSADDELDYIQRTVEFIEAAVDTKVIAICIFPIYTEPFLFGKSKLKNLSGSAKLDKIKEDIAQTIHVPVFENCEESVKDITELIIKFFSD